jgi:hypothetical protein
MLGSCQEMSVLGSVLERNRPEVKDKNNGQESRERSNQSDQDF